MRYAYKKPSGAIVWRDRAFRDGPPPREIRVDGVVATRSYQAEVKGGTPTKGWPITCFASGVNADQAQDLRDTLAKAGVPTEVTSDGDPIYRDSRHRKRALRARGLHDRRAYY